MTARQRPLPQTLALAALAVGLLSTPAEASPDSLRLAIEDLTLGVVDVAASPVTGGIATAENLDAVSDHGFLQGLYAVPGWLGLTTLQAFQGSLRVLVGALELVPGIVLFPFPDADVPEEWNVFRRGDALVDARNPLAERPAWLPWVLPVTPFTIDARIAPVSPWAIYETPEDETAAGDPRAWASTP